MALDHTMRAGYFQWHGAVDKHRHVARRSSTGMHYPSYDTEAEIRHHATCTNTLHFFTSINVQSVDVLVSSTGLPREIAVVSPSQVSCMFVFILGLVDLDGVGCRADHGKPAGFDTPFWLSKTYRRYFMTSSLGIKGGGSMSSFLWMLDTMMRLLDADLDEGTSNGTLAEKRELMFEWRYSRYNVSGFTLQPNVS